MIGKNTKNAYSFRVPEEFVRVDSKDQGGVVEMELVKVVELLEEVEQLEVLEEREEFEKKASAIQHAVLQQMPRR